MMPEFQPKFDYHPMFKKVMDEWVPDIDEAGVQLVVRNALETYHQIPWPCDETVSLVSKATYFNISKGWDDLLNPVTGRVWWIGQQSATDPTPKYLGDEAFTLKQDERWSRKPPVGTTLISVYLAPHEHAVGYSFEVLPR